jgi:hypothetical protein
MAIHSHTNPTIGFHSCAPAFVAVSTFVCHPA